MAQLCWPYHSEFFLQCKKFKNTKFHLVSIRWYMDMLQPLGSHIPSKCKNIPSKLNYAFHLCISFVYKDQHNYCTSSMDSGQWGKHPLRYCMFSSVWSFRFNVIPVMAFLFGAFLISLIDYPIITMSMCANLWLLMSDIVGSLILDFVKIVRLHQVQLEWHRL